jgi:hypothetical protein
VYAPQAGFSGMVGTTSKVEDGLLWFWNGSHADYDALIR